MFSVRTAEQEEGGDCQWRMVPMHFKEKNLFEIKIASFPLPLLPFKPPTFSFLWLSNSLPPLSLTFVVFTWVYIVLNTCIKPVQFLYNYLQQYVFNSDILVLDNHLVWTFSGEARYPSLSIP